MGSLPLTLGTGILAAVALTPSAYAADGDGVSVAPAAPAPGADVALRVTGCDTSTGTAVSDAFAAAGVLTGAAGTLTGRTRIRPVAPPGPYDVRIACGGQRITGTVTVAGAAPPTAVAPAAPAATAVPAAPAAPVAALDTAGGDPAYFASVAIRSAGPGLVHAVIGIVLVGLAAVAVGLRSARRSRDKD
ncbi:hypothetical protein ABZ922_18020 [Streptomyces shenzhenensis]|uniref:hypothetical protein n=1 Tax=Streptomyces shenzhenensis TaxID=943815 RepID=UPI00340F5F9E